MKPLKKHPKQQRMEDMTFPMTKIGKGPVFVRVGDKIKKCKIKTNGVKGTNWIKKDAPNIDIMIYKNFDAHVTRDGIEMVKTKRTYPKGLEFIANKVFLNSRGKFLRKKIDPIYIRENSAYKKVTVGDLKKGKAYEVRWIDEKNVIDVTPKEKVIWEGREYLRSISDPHHGRHVFMVLVLIVAVVIAVVVL